MNKHQESHFRESKSWTWLARQPKVSGSCLWQHSCRTAETCWGYVKPYVPNEIQEEYWSVFHSFAWFGVFATSFCSIFLTTVACSRCIWCGTAGGCQKHPSHLGGPVASYRIRDRFWCQCSNGIVHTNKDHLCFVLHRFSGIISPCSKPLENKFAMNKPSHTADVPIWMATWYFCVQLPERNLPIFSFHSCFYIFLHAFTILLSLSFHLPVRWTQKSSSIFELSHHRDVSKRYNWHQLIKVINISINISTSGFLSLPQDDLFLNHRNHPSPPSVRVTSRGVAQEKRGPWPEPMLF